MGSTLERYDSNGREKVQCRKCKRWVHRIDRHLKKNHDGLDAVSYHKEFPGAPLMSEHARKKSTNVVNLEDHDLFKFGVARLKQRQNLSEYDSMFVPTHDEEWVIDEDVKKHLEELALAIEDDDNCLIYGPPGVGKSILVRELAAICDCPLRRVNADGDMRRADFIGEKSVVENPNSGESITKWIDGVFPDAAENGHWLLVEEIDALPSHIDFVMHSALERPRHMILTGDDSCRKVNFNEDFRFIATANTLGFGDDLGRFAGTNTMNEAFLDRFGVTIKVGYPSKDSEKKILVSKTGIGSDTAEKMILVADSIRIACQKEECSVPISTRRLIDWAKKCVRLNDPRRSAEITIVNKLPEDDSKFVDNVIQKHFGGYVR